MPKIPPLPNSDLEESLMRLMAEHPGLTVADIELDPYERKYILKLTPDAAER